MALAPRKVSENMYSQGASDPHDEPGGVRGVPRLGVAFGPPSIGLPRRLSSQTGEMGSQSFAEKWELARKQWDRTCLSTQYISCSQNTPRTAPQQIMYDASRGHG